MTASDAHRPALKPLPLLPSSGTEHRWLRWLESLPWTGLSLVVAVGGLLAVAALPRSQEAERRLAVERMEIELHRTLRDLRGALVAYRADHGTWPGLDPRPRLGNAAADSSANRFARQLLMRTDATGRPSLAALPSHPFGPYLRDGLPVNPANGLASVQVLATGRRMPSGPDGMTGWIYDPATGTIRANSEGELLHADVRYYDL